MKSSSDKKRGRPAAGHSKVHAVRLPEALRADIDAWIDGQPEPKPTVSDVIRAAVEYWIKRKKVK